MKTLSKFILFIYLFLGVIYFFKNDPTIYRPFLNPSIQHFIGTNSYGKDIFSGLFSSVLDLFIIACFGYFSFLMATFFGSIQGYLKGSFDFILQRVYEVIISIPFFYVLILFTGFYELNIFILGLLLLLFNWAFLIPILRVHALKIATSSYVIQMENMGYRSSRILFFHIFPHVYYNVKHLIPFVLILFMGSLTFLDFLGLHSKSNISVGGLIFEGINNLDFPLILISGCTFMVILFLALIGLYEINKYYD